MKMPRRRVPVSVFAIFLAIGSLLLPSCRTEEVPSACITDGDYRPENLDQPQQQPAPDVNCAITNNNGAGGNHNPDDDPVILVSTLDGGLFALDKKTGSVRWKLLNEPAVKSPYDPTKPVLPAFLPDPKDGALYMMGASMQEPLKKLPFTIPELVAASPSKSADGILYSGKKVDTWFSVDRLTGARRGALSHEGCLFGGTDTCPVVQPGSFLIGRTEYNIMMFDTRTRDRRWNITYYDYSCNIDARAAKDYELAHFTASSTGWLVSLDPSTGRLEWEARLASPVVAMYQLDMDSISAVPFTSVSTETLGHLIEQFEAAKGSIEGGSTDETQLFPTLYVGEFAHGLFAVPSLVDQQTLLISPVRNAPLLIEGPQPEGVGDSRAPDTDSADLEVSRPGVGTISTNPIPRDKSSVLVFGHYQIPDYDRSDPSPLSYPYLIAAASSTTSTPSKHTYSENKVIPATNRTTNPSDTTAGASEGQRLYRRWQEIRQQNFSQLGGFLIYEVLPYSAAAIGRIENKELKMTFLVVFFTLLWFIRFVKQQFRSWERLAPNTASNSMSTGSMGGGSLLYEMTASPVELPDGHIRVGNITFHPGRVLGKGCEGTFVYQGKFDNRDVAVKRVLAACFSIADREVELLRESDEHPNVVRYFCMEQCRQFRYIALELCVATLQDFVEGKYTNAALDLTSVFRQAVQGLAHLHGLDIAHRDIKPQNVLISAPGRRGEVRAMISDFGLCKKLKLGRMSFSQRSGIAGTEGWIAPEVLLGHRSTTCMVDIFSLGCVYFYMLTRGRHPFGENFHRQANILSGRYSLEGVSGELEVSLLERMLSHEPADRPPTAAILKHPVFWSKEKLLNFLQEVSDRVDKEEENSAVLLHLERGADQVIQDDWQRGLEPAVREDLRRQRTYRGDTLKDLLRALRNKKHHYRELSQEARQLYGRMPTQFAQYWLTRFPKLALHTYTAMQCVKYEPDFVKYYDKNFDFVKAIVDKPVPDRMENRQHYRPPPVQPTKSDLSRQRDLFEPDSPADSVVSRWEDLADSGRGSPRLQSLSSSELDDMQPCSSPNQEHGGSLLGLIQPESVLQGSPLPRVRRPPPPTPSDNLEPHPPEELMPRISFAEAVRNDRPAVLTLPPPTPPLPLRSVDIILTDLSRTPCPEALPMLPDAMQTVSVLQESPAAGAAPESTPPERWQMSEDNPHIMREEVPMALEEETATDAATAAGFDRLTAGKRIRRRRKHQKKSKQSDKIAGSDDVDGGSDAESEVLNEDLEGLTAAAVSGLAKESNEATTPRCEVLLNSPR